jgi:hypothetical protein
MLVRCLIQIHSTLNAAVTLARSNQLPRLGRLAGPREPDGDLPLRPLPAAVGDRGPDPVPRFPQRGVRGKPTMALPSAAEPSARPPRPARHQRRRPARRGPPRPPASNTTPSGPSGSLAASTAPAATAPGSTTPVSSAPDSATPVRHRGRLADRPSRSPAPHGPSSTIPTRW